MVNAQELARTFVALADTLVDDFDVSDVLYVLTSGCVRLLDDVAAAGLVLADQDGRLQVAASSTGAAKFLELIQLQADEGPCVDCFNSGEQIAVDRIESADARWPQFASAALEQGYLSVCALPLRLRGQVIGALNLFGDRHTTPVVQHLPVVQAMADVATIAILQHRVAHERELVAAQLKHALDSRVLIEQAKGILAGRLERSPDEVFELLRSRARATRRRLTEVAEDVVAGSWSGYVDDESSR
jgi:GAF domain-containing protein